MPCCGIAAGDLLEPVPLLPLLRGWLQSILPQSVLSALTMTGPLLKRFFLKACSAVVNTNNWSSSLSIGAGNKLDWLIGCSLFSRTLEAVAVTSSPGATFTSRATRNVRSVSSVLDMWPAANLSSVVRAWEFHI